MCFAVFCDEPLETRPIATHSAVKESPHPDARVRNRLKSAGVIGGRHRAVPEWLIFTLIASRDAAAKTGHLVAQEIHPAYRQECQNDYAQQQRNGMRQNGFPGTQPAHNGSSSKEEYGRHKP